MAIKLLSKEAFPDKKWDKKVDELSHPRIYMYSWYLNAIGKAYSFVYDEKNDTLLPVFHNRKKILKQHYMPFFAREFQFVGKGDPEKMINFLHKKFKWSAANYHLSEEYMGKLKHYQYLKLDQPYDRLYANFSKNAKRKISKIKATEISLSFNISPEKVSEQFEANAAKKIKEIKPKNIQKLLHLMQTALKFEKGFTCGVYLKEKLIASAFFLDDADHIIYLKGSSTEEGRNLGAMYFMFDAIIEQFSLKKEALDFGGSDIENVAKFYKRFGAENRQYLHIKN